MDQVSPQYLPIEEKINFYYEKVNLEVLYNRPKQRLTRFRPMFKPFIRGCLLPLNSDLYVFCTSFARL